MTREKCAQDRCQCSVEAAFGRFCSEACAAQSREGARSEERHCPCGHPDCG